MFALRAVVVAGIGAALLAVCLGLHTRELTLAALRPGQELRVLVRSRGCFHSVKRSFAFERRLDGRLARLGADGRILAADEAEGIDDELAYARTNRDTDGTTVRHFDLALSEGGHQIAAASFTDESCGSAYGMLFALARE